MTQNEKLSVHINPQTKRWLSQNKYNLVLYTLAVVGTLSLVSSLKRREGFIVMPSPGQDDVAIMWNKRGIIAVPFKQPM